MIVIDVDWFIDGDWSIAKPINLSQVQPQQQASTDADLRWARSETWNKKAALL